MARPGPDAHVGKVVDRLTADYAGQVAPELVQEYVTVALEGFTSARVQQFVPVLVDRAVRSRLRAEHLVP